MDLLGGFQVSDLTIVIPLGVSIPGTPVLEYLKSCVESLDNQETSYEYDIVFACDDNVPNDVADYLKSTGHKIEWCDRFSYFKKGGIWKKIYDQWVACESPYLAFCHYDDKWSPNKIQSQLDCLKRESADICWSRVGVIDLEDNFRNEAMSLDSLNKSSLYGPTPYAFCHSTIVTRAILDSGILEFEDKWSAVYEQLFFMYSHKLKGVRDLCSFFYHRTHPDSITNTFNDEQSDVVKHQRESTNYSLEDTWNDANSLNMESLRRSIL